MNKGKKRQRKNNDSDDDMMEDDDIIIDQAMEANKRDLNRSEGDIEMNEGIVEADFVFSGLRDNYFHQVKTLIKPLFEFENINMSSISDLILSQKEDVGTCIKTEDEDETKNPNVDLFGIFSLIPITYYFGKGGENENVCKQLLDIIKLKVDQYAENEKDRSTALNILKGSKIGYLITERAINLPQEAVPITLNFLLKEIGECKLEDSYDGKWDLDYIIVVSKFVKRIVSNDFKKPKKIKVDTNNLKGEEILQYKFESEHYLKKSVVKLSWKIPYEQMSLDYLENKNEPQYFSLMFLKAKDFVDVVNYLNDNNK